MIFETDRLVVSELVADDAQFVLDLLTEPGFINNIGDRGVRDLASASGYVARAQESYAANGFGVWRAALKHTGEPVGVCSIVKRDGLDHPDVGYALREQFWGQGFATEAGAAALAHGLTALKIPTLLAIATPSNRASIAVLEKLGMRDLGFILLPGNDAESALYST